MKEFKTIEEDAEDLGCSERFERFKSSIKAIKSKLNEIPRANYYGNARIYDNGAVYGIVKEEGSSQLDIVYKSNEGTGKYYDLSEVKEVSDFETDKHHALFLCILVSAGGWMNQNEN